MDQTFEMLVAQLIRLARGISSRWSLLKQRPASGVLDAVDRAAAIVTAELWLVSIGSEQRAQTGEIVTGDEAEADKLGQCLLRLYRHQARESREIGKEAGSVFRQDVP